MSADSSEEVILPCLRPVAYGKHVHEVFICAFFWLAIAVSTFPFPPKKADNCMCVFWTLWPELQEMSCFCILLGYKLEVARYPQESPPSGLRKKANAQRERYSPQALKWTCRTGLSQKHCVWMGGCVGKSCPRKPAVEAHSALSPRVVSAIKAGSIVADFHLAAFSLQLHVQLCNCLYEPTCTTDWASSTMCGLG